MPTLSLRDDIKRSEIKRKGGLREIATGEIVLNEKEVIERLAVHINLKVLKGYVFCEVPDNSLEVDHTIGESIVAAALQIQNDYHGRCVERLKRAVDLWGEELNSVDSFSKLVDRVGSKMVLNWGISSHNLCFRDEIVTGLIAFYQAEDIHNLDDVQIFFEVDPDFENRLIKNVKWVSKKGVAFIKSRIPDQDFREREQVVMVDVWLERFLDAALKKLGYEVSTSDYVKGYAVRERIYYALAKIMGVKPRTLEYNIWLSCSQANKVPV